MAEPLVARQPIHDPSGVVAGYELLLRGPDGREQLALDADVPGESVLLDALCGLGIERLVGLRPAHVPVSRGFLFEGPRLPPAAAGLVLRLPPGCERDPELAAALARLAATGQALALSAPDPDPGLDGLLSASSSVCLDMLDGQPDELAARVALARRRGLPLLATGVETHEQLELCRSLGFELLQGFYFCRPRPLGDRGVPTNRVAVLTLLGQLHTPGVGVDDLEAVISGDVGLAYRLLRYLGSAYFGLRGNVSSVPQALVLLGLRNVRRWATLLAFAGLSDAPEELLTCALLRARMCESLAWARREEDPEAFFAVGMFSVLDALLEQPMPELLADLPLDVELKEALLFGRGPKGELLEAVLAYERGRLDEALSLSVSRPELNELYMQAVSFATGTSGALRPITER